MANEFYAKLGIFSTDLSPDRVTAMLGLKCDRGYEKGDIVRPHGTVHRKEHQWFIYSRISKDAPIEAHVKDVLERITPIVDKIRILSDQSDTDIELSCVIHSKEEPPLFFTKDMITILCRMGASIDIDLYFYERTGENLGNKNIISDRE